MGRGTVEEYGAKMIATSKPGPKGDRSTSPSVPSTTMTLAQQVKQPLPIVKSVYRGITKL